MNSINLSDYNEIKDRIKEIQIELSFLKNEAAQFSECDECQEYKLDCESVNWYPESDDSIILCTCGDCQKKYSKYIKK